MNQPNYTPGPYDTPGMIRTFTGKYVDVFDPTPKMICIEDIAHALAHQCRFGGHMKRFFSVAQHSVMCASHFDEPDIKLQALLHDASEAYLLDFPKPIKDKLPAYEEMEERLMDVISRKFNFKFPVDEEMKKIDQYMCETEWNHLVITDSQMLESWRPKQAKHEFLKTYRDLTTAHVSA